MTPAPSDAALARAISLARARDLAHARQWHVLLHYQRTAFGGWKSEADGADFFLGGRAGRTDPHAELEGTLTALFRASPSLPELKHPQCLFPARTTWLRAELGLDPQTLPEVPCPIYTFWRTAIAARAVTLVYATAYLNSPASMYGHTFLRLSRATGEGNPLLDYVVNFAADADTDNGLLYAAKGLAGGFPGHYYLMPYYVKVQEYSNLESRDLSEYQLALSPTATERLVAHVWELRSTYFDYFFLTENCSYALLTLLEAAEPRLHLVERLGGPHVIPADTVRIILKEKGLVTARAPRPAVLTTMKRRRALLAPDEIEAAEAWAKLPADAAPVDLGARSAERKAAILDAAYEYLRFRTGLKNAPTPEFKRKEHKLLLARGAAGVPAATISNDGGVGAPEDGHDTFRMSFGWGLSNHDGPFQRLTLRGALHDFLDPSPGYPADAVLEMGRLSLQFDDRARRLRLDRLDLINIVSALPMDRWIQGASWQVWFGVDNARELGCDRPGSDRAGWRCLYVGATTGGGTALRFGRGEWGLLYAMAGVDVGAGPAFSGNHSVRAGAGAEATFVAALTSWWRLEARARWFYYPLSTSGGVARAALTQAWQLTRAAALRAGVATTGTYAEATLMLHAYF